MKTESSPQPRHAEESQAEASAQAAVQVALDRRDNGGRGDADPDR